MTMPEASNKKRWLDKDAKLTNGWALVFITYPIALTPEGWAGGLILLLWFGFFLWVALGD